MAAPIAAISAKDNASEIHPNLRAAHHSAVFSVAMPVKLVREIMRPKGANPRGVTEPAERQLRTPATDTQTGAVFATG
jgi:hypothetical protein